MNNNTTKTINLIGQNAHRDFIEIQASIGIAQRGGTIFNGSQKHQQRLVNDVNLLTGSEKRKLIFLEAIFSN